MKNIFSYSEAETYEQDFFFYDYAPCNYDPSKTPIDIICPYCSSLAIQRDFAFGINTSLFICEKCGWWTTIRAIEGGGFSAFKKSEVFRGILKKYPIDSLDVPIKELRYFLKRHPSNMAFSHPTVFEKLMVDCIKYTHKYCEVKHVGGTGDGGVDIILVSLDEGKRLVQVKRREDLLSTEGVKVVRELNGVLFRENIPNGMVISTAKKFSKAALKEIDITALNREEYDMKLFTYNDIIELFDIIPDEPYKPWEQFVKEKTHVLNNSNPDRHFILKHKLTNEEMKSIIDEMYNETFSNHKNQLNS